MQTLYNGIQLPDVWPPRDMHEVSGDALPVPYLAVPPALIRIDRHRQLFVDDFLIDGTTMERHFHMRAGWRKIPYCNQKLLWKWAMALRLLTMAAGLMVRNTVYITMPDG